MVVLLLYASVVDGAKNETAGRPHRLLRAVRYHMYVDAPGQWVVLLEGVGGCLRTV